MVLNFNDLQQQADKVSGIGSLAMMKANVQRNEMQDDAQMLLNTLQGVKAKMTGPWRLWEPHTCFCGAQFWTRESHLFL